MFALSCWLSMAVSLLFRGQTLGTWHVVETEPPWKVQFLVCTGSQAPLTCFAGRDRATAISLRAAHQTRSSALHPYY